MNIKVKHAYKGESDCANRLVDAILRRGYEVSVRDGSYEGEWTLAKSTDKAKIMDALCTTGEDTVRARTTDGKLVGDFVLIWGNDPDGSELIADNTATTVCEAIYNEVTI